MNNGSCVNDVGRFLCNCLAGYSDSVCGTGRSEILEDCRNWVIKIVYVLEILQILFRLTKLYNQCILC